MPMQGYSGLGQDTPGPAGYDPRDMFVKANGVRADFTTSKIKRQVFEPNRTRENSLPAKENPGPGEYEFQMRKMKEFNGRASA